MYAEFSTLSLFSRFSSRVWELKYLHGKPEQYRDPNLVKKIKDVTGDSIHIVLDAYSEEESQLICIKAFGPGGGRLMLVQHEAPYIRRLRKDVTVQCT